VVQHTSRAARKTTAVCERCRLATRSSWCYIKLCQARQIANMCASSAPESSTSCNGFQTISISTPLFRCLSLQIIEALYARSGIISRHLRPLMRLVETRSTMPVGDCFSGAPRPCADDPNVLAATMYQFCIDVQGTVGNRADRRDDAVACTSRVFLACLTTSSPISDSA
jgi:hypothetical protein